ncbi:MAG: protein TolQ [bacterium]|nr:protein TolQ [bacterium]MDT8395356.1 protein TolQ [bacterium]
MIADLTIIPQLATAQVGREVELGVLSMILRAGPVVQLVLILLLLMSVMTWAIIFYKWRMFRQAETENRRFHNLFLHQQRLSTIHEGAEEMTFSPVASIFRAGYIELVRVSRMRQQQTANDVPEEPGGLIKEVEGLDNIKRALSKAAETELTRLERALPFLATTGSTAPFIGLFGTVWGIMNAFRSIGLAGSASLLSVAPGISEALVATAGGLAAAIPAVVGYNYFIQKIRILDNDMSTFTAEFLNIIERHFRRKS